MREDRRQKAAGSGQSAVSDWQQAERAWPNPGTAQEDRALQCGASSGAKKCSPPCPSAGRPSSPCPLLSAICLLLSAFYFLPAVRAQNDEHQESPQAKTPPPAVSRIAPKALEVLKQAIQSLGGETFLQAKTVYTRGRTYAISENSASAVVPFESTVEFPDKRRFAYGKDKPITLINDGERGWQIDRYGMVRQPPDQVRRWKNGARYGYENLLRRVIHEDGVLIQDAGRDFTENLAVRVVSITDAQQVQIRIYLSTVNSLPIRVTYRLQHPETRDWEEFGETYSDYREFQGIQTPRHVTRSLDGERYSEVFRNEVEYNREVPAHYFSPGS